MELVYLWVEKYKNIENGGFNFSPRFTCSYDKDSEKLTIDKKEHVEDFFGKNINVTAIVGENGSGKTSIFDEIITTMPSGIIVYFIDDKFKVLASEYILKKINNKTGKEVNKLEKNIHKNIKHINSDMMKLDKMEGFFDHFSTRNQFSNEHFNLSKDGLSKIDLSKYEKNINAIIIKYFNLFKDSNFFHFEPSQIQIFNTTTDIESDLIDKINKFTGKGLVKITELKLNKDEFWNLSNFISENTISVGIKDEKNRDVYDLSQGERKSLVDSLILLEHINNNENSLILLDEPDLAIHPKWQKSYINDLITSYKKLDKKIHFVITSHSPFILSDLPKENVIFLKDGKQVDVDIDTFGANIHTLLSHGFFMQDGLMGEFAKGKINDVINYLNDKKSNIKSDDEAQKIVNIIGEPILKRQLQKMLDSRRLSEVEQIKKQIKELQEELAKKEDKKYD